MTEPSESIVIPGKETDESARRGSPSRERRLVGFLGTLSLLLSAAVVYLLWHGGRSVVSLRTPAGVRSTISAAEVRRELILAHGAGVLRHLMERELAHLAARDNQLTLDVEELETRYYMATQTPDTRAKLDLGELTERELRRSIERDILLDQITTSRLSLEELEVALRDFYARHQRELEEIRVRHILVGTQREAEDVAQRLTAGVEFAPLAQRFSLDPLSRDQGGDLGWKKRRDLPSELSPLLFLIPPGRISNPVSTEYGWDIFMIEEKRSDFEALRDTVRREWCREKRPETLAELKKLYHLEQPGEKETWEALAPVADRFHLPAENGRP